MLIRVPALCLILIGGGGAAEPMPPVQGVTITGKCRLETQEVRYEKVVHIFHELLVTGADGRVTRFKWSAQVYPDTEENRKGVNVIARPPVKFDDGAHVVVCEVKDPWWDSVIHTIHRNDTRIYPP